MELLIKEEHKNFRTPVRGTVGSAGFDCFVADYFLRDNCIWYNLGFSLELPVGYFALLTSRSSVISTGGMQANCVGVIDSDFRGVWHYVFRPLTNTKEMPYSIGDRCCQFIVLPALDISFIEVTNLDSTARKGGFGSTGT